MDLHEARDRRELNAREPEASRRATARKRADEARLRRAIREAFARQRQAPAAPADVDQAPPRLRVVRDDAQ